jgi:hypothetical protein
MSAPLLAASTSLPPYTSWREDPPSAASSSTTTYAGQAQLPPLPVPKLEDTLRKLKTSGRAVARDASEAAIFEAHVDAFASDEIGRALQKRLQVKADQTCAAAVGPSNPLPDLSTGGPATGWLTTGTGWPT